MFLSKLKVAAATLAVVGAACLGAYNYPSLAAAPPAAREDRSPGRPAGAPKEEARAGGAIEVLHEVELARLEPGATLDLCNASHEFIEVPAGLKGRHYTKRHGFQGVMRFRVNGPQRVTIALYGHDWGGGGNPGGGWLDEVVPREELERQGWKEVARLRSRPRQGVEQVTTWIVFTRDCKAGEAFAIRNHKYLAPFLITGGAVPAVPPGSKEAPGKPGLKAIDLGADRLRVEMHPPDKLPPGLFAAGVYPLHSREHIPLNARQLYEAARGAKTFAPFLQIVGRLAGTFPPGVSLRAERFDRVGGKITAVIQVIPPPAGGGEKGDGRVAYVQAYLPTLPPGRYSVELATRVPGPVRGGGEAAHRKEKVLTCSFEVPEGYDPAAELKRLALESIGMTPGGVRPRKGDQSPTGMDLGKMLELTGQEADRARAGKDPGSYRQDVEALVRAGKTWALCALLDHDHVDAKVAAAHGLARLADPSSVPVLLAAAKRNNYPVAGGENATLHSLYRRALKDALEKVTGLALTPGGLSKTVIHQGASGTTAPPRVIRSDDDPKAFPEEVDFAKAEGWLRGVFLAGEKPAGARPGGPPAAGPRQPEAGGARPVIGSDPKEARGYSGESTMYLGDTMTAPAAARKAPREGGLALEVEFDRREYLLGEPVWVRCSLVNYGREPVTISYGRYEAKNTILFDIEKRVRRRPSERDSLGPQPLTIDPGYRLVEWYSLLEDYELTGPGEYTANVRYESDGTSFHGGSLQTRTDHWKGKLERPLGAFTIVKPTRPEDQAALEWLLTNSTFGEVPREGRYGHLFYADRPRFGEFLERHGNSRYAAYARYGDAFASLKFARGAGAGKLAQPAVERLGAVDPKGYPALFAERRLFHLIQAHTLAGSKPEQITPLAKDFLARYPESPHVSLVSKAAP